MVGSWEFELAYLLFEFYSYMLVLTRGIIECIGTGFGNSLS